MFFKNIFDRLSRGAILGLVLLLNACAGSPPVQPDDIQRGDYQAMQEYMRWYIKDQMDEQDIVGMSIALVDDQTIVWQEGFGYADKKNKIKASPQTIYRAGSVSKVFNAIAAMQLNEQGKFDIDAPLKQYLPSFTMRSRFGSTDSITPRMLLTHHSGIPGDWYDGFVGEDVDSFTDLAKQIQAQYVAYPPNTILSYSNLGISLLGDAIQKTAGLPYSELLQKQVLDPMGMQHSHFAPALEGNLAAKAYADGKEVREFPLRDVPAGGLNTSVEDLARLAIMVNQEGEINGNQILAKETLARMFVHQNKHIELDQAGMQIGLGWFLDDAALNEQEPAYGHGGSTIAHNAHFIVAPESKLGVALLSNTESANAREIANHLLQRAWQVKTGKIIEQAKLDARKDSTDPSGHYAGIFGNLEVVPLTQDKYKVNIAGESLNLKRADDGYYYAKYKLLGLLPIPIGELGKVGFYADRIAGYDVLIGETPTQKIIAGTRIKPTEIDLAWLNRLGHYALQNALPKAVFEIEQLELKQENGFLIARLSGPNDSHEQFLKTVNASEAIIQGLGRDLQETVRIITSEEGELIGYNGLRFKRVE